jgi:hypothetical protein
MRTISCLVASAVCAAVLGLATSGFVGAHVSGLLSSEEKAVAAGREDVEWLASTLPPRNSLCSGDGETAEAKMLLPAKPPRLAALRARDKGRSAHRTRPRSGDGPPTDSLSEELSHGIRKLGEHRHEIKRGAVDLALANLMSLSKFAHAALEARNGKPFGFRLFAVVADGPFAKLGLRDGDILVSVNGLVLTSLDQALQAYGKLKTARHFELRLVRGGHEMVEEYVVR